MADGFPLSIETVLLFLAILLIAFCCGFLRSLKKVFNTRAARQTAAHRNILVTHIRIPNAPVQRQNDSDISGVFPAEEQLSPPPYSAVSNILPPSYDEAIKRENGENESPKVDTRY